MNSRRVTILSVLSIGVCLWAAVAWAFSYLGDRFEFGSCDGRLLLIFVQHPEGVAGYPPVSRNILHIRGWDWKHLGLWRDGGADYQSRSWQIIGVPYFWFILPCIPVPVWWLRHSYRLRRRDLRRLCSQCGYDLRATPDRCPECGAITAAPAIDGY